MLIPYVEVNGIRTIPDSDVKAAYRQLIYDGTDKIVFFEGGVKDEDSFLRMIKNPNNLMVFIVKDDKYAGFAWINNLLDHRAFGHFAFFKSVWGQVDDLGKEILDYWFSIPGKNGPLLDVIVGIVPKFNTLANNYIRQIGFKTLGEIPMMMTNHYTDERISAVISYVLRIEHGKEGSANTTV